MAVTEDIKLDPTKKKLTSEQMHAALRKQPLVGLVAAANILGIAPPNVTRLRTQGRMPDPVHVEGSADVYLKSDIQKLARALSRERAKRDDGKR